MDIDQSPEFRDVYGVTNRVDTFAKQFAVVMETAIDGVKFADMDVIIADNSANLGGSSNAWQAFGSFFGQGDRLALSGDANLELADNGNTPTLLYADTIKKICPDIPLDLLIDPVAERTIPTGKYQAQYPEATFTGSKIVHLTSTVAYSAGDMYPHYFRNHQGPDYSDIGGGVKSILIGALDGRLHGSSAGTFSYGVGNRSVPFHVAPSVNGPEVHLAPFILFGESFRGVVDSYSGEYVSNQLPYIAVDGLNGGGPIDAWVENEGGVYQAFGFTTPYARATPQYQVFNDVIGLPDAFDPSTRHYPWLEDAILEACQ